METLFTVIAVIFWLGGFALLFSRWILIFWRGLALLFGMFSKWRDFEIEKAPDRRVIVKKYVGSSKKVVVPKGATVIGEGAFAGKASIESIFFPAGLKTIETGAFFQCVNLTQVRFSEGLETIEAYAFSHSPIREVVLPSSLKKVESGAFSICFAFAVSEGNANYVAQDGVLFTRDMSTLVRYPGGSDSKQYSVPECVKRIAEESFSNSLFLRRLELPDNLEEIDDHAFLACRLDEITIPASVTKIGVGAFTRTGKIVVSEGNQKYFSTDDGVLFNFDLTLVSYPGGRGARDYRVPDDTEHIEEKAFYYAMTLENVILPESLKSIGNQAFCGCKELTSVYVPNNVKDAVISNPTAFENCPKLTNVKTFNPIEGRPFRARIFINDNGELKEKGDLGFFP